jgi:RHS repeat-associated protein
LDQDANGSLASVEFPSGAEHTFAYNAAGLLEAYTTPRGFGYAFTYDTLGRLTLDEDPAGGSKALVKLDTLGGSRTSLTTGMGRTRIYDLIPSVDRSEVQRNHDAAGLITTVGWSGSGSITTTTPDGMENMVTMGPEPLAKLQNMQPVGVSTTSPNGLLRETYQQQTVELRDADSILSLDTYVEEKTVNGEVFRLEYSNPTRSWISTSSEGRKDTVLVDSLGRILQRFVSGAETIEYGYDSHGRLETISQGAGAEERETRLFYNSSGYLEAIRNPLGDTTTFEYDADGRIVKEIRPGGAEVEYGYDADGNIDSLAPPGKPTHAFQFNSLGADTVYAPPSLGAGLFATSTGYNLDHQMLAIRRPDSLLIEFKYDAAGRTDSILTSLGAYHFGYNSETGTLDTLVSPYGVETRFEYDGSLMTGIHWAGTMAGSVATAYNDEFRVETVTVGGGSPVAYSYDYDGLIDEIGSLQYSWDLSGRLRNRSISDYNDLMNYDAFGQPAEFTAVTGADDTVYQYNLTRDKLGRVREKVETIGGVTHSYQYEYDVTGKLVQVDIDSAFWTGYAYDENGNRLTRSRAATTDTGDYDAQDRLTQYGNQSFVYGRNGELDAKVVLGDTTRYKYDVHGNLLKVAFSTGDSITYLIDGMNRRVTKKVNGATVLNYLYHNASLYPIATTDSIGAVLQRFLYAPGRYSPDQVLVGDTVFILVYDNVGSLRLVVNNTTNAIVQRMDYDEFGATTFDSNPGFTPFGYAGGMYEGAAGLIRFGARDYMPSVGRWATKDPIGFGGGMNQYAYVENDPVNFFDPSGLRPGDRFLTADQAGNDAASWYNGPSQASNVEYGGWIVRNSDGSFSATKGTTQGNPFTVDIGEKPCNGAGWYHTHGASVESSKENHVDWNNRPSPEDREYGADPSVNLPGYLGVPKGPTLKFGPGMKSPTQKWNPSRGGYGNPSL